MHPYRSILFVPGHKPQWAHKAVMAGADAVVLDLEDSVAPEHKDSARATVRGALPELRAQYPDLGPVSNTHLTLPTTDSTFRSPWSPEK